MIANLGGFVMPIHNSHHYDAQKYMVQFYLIVAGPVIEMEDNVVAIHYGYNCSVIRKKNLNTFLKQERKSNSAIIGKHHFLIQRLIVLSLNE